MAWTIIEVERKTKIPSRTLRFWLDKGLFPYVERDSNGVRYFAKSDVEWAKWIDCLRRCDMSINDIRKYVSLHAHGIETAPVRKGMLEKQLKLVSERIAFLHEISTKLTYKITLYDQMILEGKDSLNPNSAQYEGCKKPRHKKSYQSKRAQEEV